MDGRKDTVIEAVLEHLIEHGPDDIATVFGRAFELAMQVERERFLRAGSYERTSERRGYANGYKPKRIDTPAGTVTVDVPKTAGHEGEPFYPHTPTGRDHPGAPDPVGRWTRRRRWRTYGPPPAPRSHPDRRARRILIVAPQ